jgi:hypothetical protein
VGSIKDHKQHALTILSSSETSLVIFHFRFRSTLHFDMLYGSKSLQHSAAHSGPAPAPKQISQASFQLQFETIRSLAAKRTKRMQGCRPHGRPVEGAALSWVCAAQLAARTRIRSTPLHPGSSHRSLAHCAGVMRASACCSCYPALACQPKRPVQASTARARQSMPNGLMEYGTDGKLRGDAH